MDKLILDPSLRSVLGPLDHDLEVCDEAGRTLGFYVPAPSAPAEVYQWAKAAVTDEELEDRRREPLGSTTAEVLQRLERL